MPRPRIHDLDRFMDAAERIAVESGPSAVTVRALSEAASVSNGAIYHAFGSRAGLVGRVWLRAAQRFLALQRAAVEQAAAGTAPSAAVEAVVAAADSTAEFLVRHPASGRFLLAVRRRELLGAHDLPADIAEELRTLDRILVELFVELSQGLWGRGDREAVAVVRDCVVELPTALLLRGARRPDTAGRERLAAAVRAIAALTPAFSSESPRNRTERHP